MQLSRHLAKALNEKGKSPDPSVPRSVSRDKRRSASTNLDGIVGPAIPRVNL